jgi:lysophospholipase L1-like esterase
MKLKQLCSRVIVISAATVALLLSSADLRAQELLIKDGQTIAFMGDSITWDGARTPSGYVCLVISGLEMSGVKVIPIPVGVIGHKSDDMLARLERDVLSRSPDWMLLSCGVNDVWYSHNVKEVPIERYKDNIAKMVDLCQAKGVKVLILTSTMIGEDQVNPMNQKLIAYNDVLRNLAREKNCPLADLNADMQAELKRMGSDLSKPGTLLTRDGIHVILEGNLMMATGILKTMGLNDEQIQKVKGRWSDMPEACEVAGRIKYTLREFRKLREIAREKNMSLDAMLKDEFQKSVEALLGSRK